MISTTMKLFLLRLVIAGVCFSCGVSVSSWLRNYKLSKQTASRSPKQTASRSPKTEAYYQGKREFERDLSQGLLKFRIYGLPVEWNGPDLYAEYLRKDYGIELVRVAGCGVDDLLVERTRGYDELSLATIESRFGKGLLDRVHQRAVIEWERTHKRK